MTKILLVEDDKSLREIYGVRLLAEGYDIVSAGDGEEALAMAIKDRPNLIVSDVMMPKISGFDMLDILRSTTETKDIKVIMMTALSSEDQRQRGVALGADRYLVKSQVGIEDVVRTVHEVLGDAPIASLSSSPAAAPAAPAATPSFSAPVVPPRPTEPAVTSPAPIAPAAPVAPAPTPVAAAPSMPPSATFDSTVSAPVSPLPQPTAPFSTPRPGAGTTNRVIEPLPVASTDAPDLDSMMKAALTEASAAPAPVAEPTPAPVAPPAAPTPTPEPTGMNYEETPAQASATVPPVAAQPPLTAPSVPQPPQAPNPGV